VSTDPVASEREKTRTLEYQARPSSQMTGRKAITWTRAPLRESTPRAARVGLFPQWPQLISLTGTSTTSLPRSPLKSHWLGCTEALDPPVFAWKQAITVSGFEAGGTAIDEDAAASTARLTATPAHSGRPIDHLDMVISTGRGRVGFGQTCASTGSAPPRPATRRGLGPGWALHGLGLADRSAQALAAQDRV
jgi:hypothetical protein